MAPIQIDRSDETFSFPAPWLMVGFHMFFLVDVQCEKWNDDPKYREYV